MFRAIQDLSAKNEEGFTLIELLVVILIIGILAAIAVPTFLNNRKTAIEAGLKEDVKNAGTQVEGNYKQSTGYTTIDLTQFQSDGNKLSLTTNSEDGRLFCLTGINERSIQVKWYYSNAHGGLTSVDCNIP